MTAAQISRAGKRWELLAESKCRRDEAAAADVTGRVLSAPMRREAQRRLRHSTPLLVRANEMTTTRRQRQSTLAFATSPACAGVKTRRCRSK